MRLAEIGEFGLIARLKVICGEPPAEVVVGIDDDAAAFRPRPDELVVVTTDALVEGVHFRWDYFTPFQLGWRSLAANISDVAAMAAEPQYAVVSIAIPSSLEVEKVEELYRGMVALGGMYGVRIVGGDTTSSPDRLFLSITVFGTAPAQAVVRRAGARVGDALYVTGFLGQAHAGLLVLTRPTVFRNDQFPTAVARHLQPMPRVQEALFLRQKLRLTSMIDVSDGLASEVHHLCRLGNVGAVVEQGLIPISPEARAVAAQLGKRAVDFALGGGEDFELLFTAEESSVRRIQPLFEEKFGLALSKVGEIVSPQQGVQLRLESGEMLPLAMVGWDHFGRGKKGFSAKSSHDAHS
ncbi:MAG: thiamine-phosphate kinase [Candidatus Oleimicrobiaceae bacterium]